MLHLIRVLLSMLALAGFGGSHSTPPRPDCPAWCQTPWRRHHAGDGQHTRNLGVWHDDNNIVELNLCQLGDQPPYVRIFLGEEEYADVSLTGASILGRIVTEMDPHEVGNVGRALLGAWITAGGAR